MKIKVKQGIIKVNHAQVVRTNRDLIWIEIDCASKYPEYLARADETNTSQGILLSASKRTLNVSDKKNATEVIVEGLSGPHYLWNVFVPEVGRYSVTLVLVREPKRRGVHAANYYAKR